MGHNVDSTLTLKTFLCIGETMEILVVASKVKKLIKEQGGLSTSSGVFESLTKQVEGKCLEAIENATKAKRKSVMDRDFGMDGEEE